MYIREGFPGQRLHVLPSPLVLDALGRKPTSRLLVTDAGLFPRAAMHGRTRKSGASEAIVIMCLSGSGWYEIGSARHRIHAGEALVIPPGQTHLYHADKEHPWTIWWMHVTGEDVPDLLSAIGLPADQPSCRISDAYRAFALIEQVVDYLEQDETMASLINAAGAAWNLLALLAAERDGRNAGDNEPIRQAQQYLREHLDKVIEVPALASRAGLSTSHFSARFRAATGFSVIEYVKRLRMARARRLLITTDHTVAEIGESVGYADPFYFSRQFRTVHGVSPSQFRSRADDASADVPTT